MNLEDAKEAMSILWLEKYEISSARSLKGNLDLPGVSFHP
jgi:hypothetical protein